MLLFFFKYSNSMVDAPVVLLRRLAMIAVHETCGAEGTWLILVDYFNHCIILSIIGGQVRPFCVWGLAYVGWEVRARLAAAGFPFGPTLRSSIADYDCSTTDLWV